jgi:hypothetical protein
MEAFPTFKKLWGSITGTLPAGTYSVTVNPNTFDVSSWQGKKSLYLSTVGTFGGTNDFLGLSFLMFSGLTFLVMVAFVVMRLIKGDKLKEG